MTIAPDGVEPSTLGALGGFLENNMQFCNLDQRTEAWLQWRREGITATEAKTILGCDSYSGLNALWRKKVGLEPEKDLSHVPAVAYGIAHEGDCRRAWELKHGDFAFPVCAISDVSPVFRASFDGINSAGEPVECKCVQKDTFERVRAQGRESDAYKRYLPQVQHQLLVSGARRAFLCFWHEGLFHEFEVERDEALIAEIVKRGKAFWENHVLTGIAPDPDPYMPTGADAQAWAAIAEDYKRALKVKSELESALKSLNERLKAHQESLEKLMGDEEVAQYAGIRVKRSKRAGGVDWKAYCETNGVDQDDLRAFQKPDVVTTRVLVL